MRAWSAVATAVFTVAFWPSPAVLKICDGLPGNAVAPKERGEPMRPPTDAVAESTPAAVPRTRVAEAKPLASVFDDGVTEPPPAVTTQVTGTPCTPLPRLSVTRTVYAARLAPIVSVCTSPLS